MAIRATVNNAFSLAANSLVCPRRCGAGSWLIIFFEIFLARIATRPAVIKAVIALSGGAGNIVNFRLAEIKLVSIRCRRKLLDKVSLFKPYLIYSPDIHQN